MTRAVAEHPAGAKRWGPGANAPQSRANVKNVAILAVPLALALVPVVEAVASHSRGAIAGLESPTAC